jgi:hypothetical protein
VSTAALRSASTFGQPNVFDSLEAGLAIDDFWPSLYIGADRVAEMQRRQQFALWPQTT